MKTALLLPPSSPLAMIVALTAITVDDAPVFAFPPATRFAFDALPSAELPETVAPPRRR